MSQSQKGLKLNQLMNTNIMSNCEISESEDKGFRTQRKNNGLKRDSSAPDLSISSDSSSSLRNNPNRRLNPLLQTATNSNREKEYDDLDSESCSCELPDDDYDDVEEDCPALDETRSKKLPSLLLYLKTPSVPSVHNNGGTQT